MRLFVFAKIFGCEDRFLSSDVGVGSTRPAGTLAYPPPVSMIQQTLANTRLFTVRYSTVADNRPFITPCYRKAAPQYNYQAYYNNRKLFCRCERAARFNPSILSNPLKSCKILSNARNQSNIPAHVLSITGAKQGGNASTRRGSHRRGRRTSQNAL